MKGIFVSSTGTGCGKTYVARSIVAALRARNTAVRGLKPIETGVDPVAQDAEALARTSGDPALADARGFYRARHALAPLACHLEGEALPPSTKELAAACKAAAANAYAVVEGAGGLFVPLDHAYDVADLALDLGLQTLLVAPDRLGVLSDVVAHHAGARQRGVPLAGVVLVALAPRNDLSPATNQQILANKLTPLPVLRFPTCGDDDAALAAAAQKSGLLSLLGLA